MANAILFISWKNPHPGMDKEAYGFLTTEGVGFLKKHEGKAFEKMEMIGLTAHGGEMNGAVILSGQRAKLDELRRTDEFEAFVMKMGGLFDRLGVVPGVNWEGLQAVMTRMSTRG